LLAPGLSVIIDAIKEGRKTFQRMNSYAIYRITETIRVLLFMTLSILVFNFYPVTAVMIVLLAPLNDAAILTIAYDPAGAHPAGSRGRHAAGRDVDHGLRAVYGADRLGVGAAGLGLCTDLVPGQRPRQTCGLPHL
jgi:hypothetical protein